MRRWLFVPLLAAAWAAGLAAATPAAGDPLAFFAPPRVTCAPAEPIRVLDLSALQQVDLHNAAATRAAWDALHLAASLQGLVNRKGPRLFLRFLAETDDFWFTYCTETSGWLKGRPVERLSGVDGLLQLVERYADDCAGLVVYGDKPYALSNVASTLAGAERRLAVHKDEQDGSLYRRLLALKRRPHDVLDLTKMTLVPRAGSCGSPKNDAYRWAKERCLDRGRCSRAFMAYYIDMYYLTDPGGGGAFSNATLSNHDFYIANGAFFFDLDPWGDEIPNDEPGQPKGADRATLVSLLKAQNARAGGRNFIIGGFPPWAWKYADRAHRFNAPDGRRHPVQTEWEYARLISSYNAMKDADALGFSGLANASFYRFFPLCDRYAQAAPAPSDDALRAQGVLKADGSVADKIYLTWYMGDYDAAAWLNTFAPKWWQDPARGRTLGSWAFDPLLAVRVPQAVHYVRTQASARDWFISGDNGFGYLMPSSLSAPRLDPSIPDGWSAWAALNRAAFRRFDLGVTGFVIDPGDAAAKRRIADEYAQFSPEGFVSDEGQAPGEVRLARGVPYVKMYLDLYGEPPQAAAQLADLFRKEDGTRFLMVRTILKSPTWHEQVTQQLLEKTGDRVVVLDPRSFFRLARLKAEKEVSGDGRK